MTTKRKVILIGVVTAMIATIIPMFIVLGGGDKGFKTTPKGLQYRYIKDNKQPKAKLGDFITVHMTYKTDKDSVLFTSREMNKNEPLEIPVSAPQFNGDATEGFIFLGVGDSVEFKMPVDSIFKGQQMPSFAKPGGFIHMYVNVVKVMTKEEREKVQTESAGKQNGIDEEIIKNYLKDKNITAQKTSSGLYYVIEKQGDGAKVEAGKSVSVNYTGMLTDGKAFDSNTDEQFHHVQPLDFVVGQGQVIKGWDEGLQLLNVGGKGKLIIPSSLAYGAKGAGASIPANAVLVFDVEVVGLK